jgi:hypothetical protein
MNRAAAMNSVTVILIAALAVCVFAVTLAFLVAPIFSSEAFLQWVTTTAPCGAAN